MPQNEEKRHLPNQPESYWLDKSILPDYPALSTHIDVDVIIVGAGITGITSAYLLANEGFNVAILEAGKALNGTTGHTTAKVTAQHGLIYNGLIQNVGEQMASLYYQANADALSFMRKTIGQLDISCDFLEQDAFIYSTTEQYARTLEKEAEAYSLLGIDGELVASIPFNLDIQNALVMRNQAQFHPVKYLSRLLEASIEKGASLFERTTAVNIQPGERPTVFTRDGATATADYVLLCSHFPFYEGTGLYSTRLHADRSYVIAAKTKKDYPGGMYISAEQPTRSLRSLSMDGESYVLIGGESHKAGQGGDTLKCYEALEAFGEDVFGLEAIPYRWSAQDLITLDNIPYIGSITSGHDNLLIATGYRKWGMTNGTAAALLFKDMVLKKESKYETLFSPSRFHMNPSLKNVLMENANVAGHLLKGKLEMPETQLNDLSLDEGAVMMINGHRKGVYKDSGGKLHMVDTTCTHIGCEVEWNNGERTWDCPCHGSRFSITGEVIEGPAEKPLQQYDYTMLDNLTSDDSGY
ncbi:FAD-dependent oxidoreductase [Bacillus sp. 1P06AnD]|uniref:FAD-dependent oxidoreductase n=1 Tax=Bacillus sp. 1P06AnD TaxID=3132208 RepID=UPI0039A3CDD5